MCIRKILSDIRGALIKGILLSAMVCMQGITPSEAAICFLPTGECEETVSIKTESCKNWSASEREQVCSSKNGYVKAAQVATKESQGYSCASAISALGDICCPGWYYCTEVNCQDRGFKLKEQLDPRHYICEPCTQGGDTFYKCRAKPCNYDANDPTASTLEDVCTNTNNKYCVDSIRTNLCTKEIVNGQEVAYVWTASADKKAGKRACGKCEASTEPPAPKPCLSGSTDCVKCKNNRHYWKEQLPGGCVTCTVVGNVAGKDYYCCEDILEYPIPNCTDDEEGACYSCEGPVRATGADDINCYKQVEKKCGNANQYIDKSVNGCYCRDYDYYLSANPTSLNFTAAGGQKSVDVVSTISTRTSTSNYKYDLDKTIAGLCTLSDNANDTVTVNCGINTSTTPSSASFTITQTPKKVTSTHRVQYETISIKVEGDSCSPYQFSDSCPLAGWVAENRGKSVSGAANCYECVNDNCPSGYTKGATPNPAEGYLTATTDHGSNCYKAKSCEDGATTTNLNANGDCYDCTAHGYAGQTQCWLCSHMDTACDTVNGYMWNEDSCGCIAAGCTTGDVSKQSVEDCGSSGSAGWEYTYSGMSGGKKCGICTKKECSGITTDLSATNSFYSCTSCFDGDVEKFTCTCNLTDAMCGAGKSADMSTCTCKTCSDSCADHGWTANSSDCQYGSTAKSSICNIQCYECGSCSDTCSAHGWETSCTEGCNGNKKVTCTTQTDNCGGTCYSKTETDCEYGCSNGQCSGCTDTCSAHGWETSCTEGCNGDKKVTCTTQTDNCGGTCYSKTETDCEYGCSNGQCSGCTDTCSAHSWESSCTPGCNGNKKVTCTTKTDNCGGTCYSKTETECAYGCSNGECSGCTDTCSAHGWVTSSSSCSYGANEKTDDCGNTCYECKTCSDSCSNHTGWLSSCTGGCSGDKKVTCVEQTDNCGGTCYTKTETDCEYGCSGGQCTGCTDSCSNHTGWLSSCTAGCSGDKKVTCTTQTDNCGGTCYTKSETTCDYGCENGQCKSDTCANHGWITSCTSGCNGDKKVTCTNMGTINGTICYEKSEDTCTYGCEGGECKSDTCANHDWITSCTEGCNNGKKTICTNKGTINGSTCYDKSEETCSYGCNSVGNDCCTPSTCSTSTYPYTTSDLYSSTNNTEVCDPGCGQPKRYKCKEHYKLKNGECKYDECPVAGEKKSISELSCDYGTETGTSTAAGTTCYKCKSCTDTCSAHSWVDSCTEGCSGDKKVTCETKEKICNTQCYKKSETTCAYGCSNGECNGCTDTCSAHGWVDSCTAGCNGNKKVTCTAQTDNCGGTCYTKSETTCTYGCSNGECNGCTDTCSAHGWEEYASDCDYGSDTKTDDCGNTCYECKACSDTCSNHGWKSSSSSCDYGSNPKTDDCGNTCYECKSCDDTCPVSGEKKNESELSCSFGTTTGTLTECGTACYKCNPCPPGLYNSLAACNAGKPSGYICSEANTVPGASCWVANQPTGSTAGSFSCSYSGSSGGNGHYNCVSSVSGNISTIRINGAEYGNWSSSKDDGFIGELAWKTCEFLNGTQVIGTDTFSVDDSSGWSCSY